MYDATWGPDLERIPCVDPVCVSRRVEGKSLVEGTGRSCDESPHPWALSPRQVDQDHQLPVSLPVLDSNDLLESGSIRWKETPEF